MATDGGPLRQQPQVPGRELHFQVRGLTRIVQPRPYRRNVLRHAGQRVCRDGAHTCRHTLGKFLQGMMASLGLV